MSGYPERLSPETSAELRGLGVASYAVAGADEAGEVVTILLFDSDVTIQTVESKDAGIASSCCSSIFDKMTQRLAFTITCPSNPNPCHAQASKYVLWTANPRAVWIYDSGLGDWVCQGGLEWHHCPPFIP